MTILAEAAPAASIGTIWSSSPWMISVGTSNFFEVSVKSVSEKALMQSYAALRPACMPCSQNASRTPCETFEPGRLAP